MAVTTKTTKIYNDTELWNSNDTDQKNKNNKTDNKNKSNNIKNENNIDTKNNSNTNSKNRFSVNDVLRRIDVESCCLRKRFEYNNTIKIVILIKKRTLIVIKIININKTNNKPINL